MMTRSMESSKARPVRLNARWGYAILAALLWVLPLIPEVRVWLVDLNEQVYWLAGGVSVGLIFACLGGIIKGDQK